VQWVPHWHLSRLWDHLARVDGCDIDVETSRWRPLVCAFERGRIHQPDIAAGHLDQVIADRVAAAERLSQNCRSVRHKMSVTMSPMQLGFQTTHDQASILATSMGKIASTIRGT
jgi:hypothetical protein